MPQKRKPRAPHKYIFCCCCDADVKARLTTGAEIYPKHRNLHNNLFWRCDECGNYVGCHNKSKEPSKPLGCIPTPELRKLRQEIHVALDAIWKSGRLSRSWLYNKLSEELVCEYHTGDIRTVEFAERVLRILRGYQPRPSDGPPKTGDGL
jgi:hypothetical protein